MGIFRKKDKLNLRNRMRDMRRAHCACWARAVCCFCVLEKECVKGGRPGFECGKHNDENQGGNLL